MHLQAPSGHQGRVIIIGEGRATYNVNLMVNIEGEEAREGRFEFTFNRDPQQNTDTCIIDFSDPKETKIVNLGKDKAEDEEE